MKKLYSILLSVLCFVGFHTAQAAKDSTGKYSVNWTFTVNGNTVVATPATNGQPPCLKIKWKNNGTVTNSWSYTTTYSAPGTYTLCCTFWDSCKKWDTMICKTVTIKGTNTKSYCDSITPKIEFKKDCKKFQFIASPAGLKNATYKWDFGDGGTGTGREPKHTFMKDGWYRVCVTINFTNPAGTVKCEKKVCSEVWAGCGKPCTLTGNYEFTVDKNGNYKFNSNSNQGFWYLWTFGDGSTAYGKDPNHTYKKPGTYTACVTIFTLNFKCKITICKTIVVPEPCKVSGSFTFKNTGNKFTFLAASVGGFSYDWSFGDGTYGTGKDPNHTYSKPGIYEVCVKIWSKDKKCYIIACKKIEIKETKKCNWSKANAGLTAQCLTVTGESPILNNGTTCVKYMWYLYGTSVVYNTRVFSHTFTAAGTYKFCLKILDSCNKCDTIICREVTVKKCEETCKWPNKTIGSQAVCNKVYFTAPFYNDSCIKYSWTFDSLGTGAGQNTFYSFPVSADTQYYKVCLKLTNTCKGCDTTICMKVKVAPCKTKCSWTGAGFSAWANCRVVSIEAAALNKTCLKYTYSYTSKNGSTVNMGTVYKRNWEYKLPATGTYTLCMKVSDTCNKCDTTICKSITINCDTCKAVAYFTIDSISGAGKLYVTNQSVNAGSYYWTFGDGTTSTDKSPSKTYSAGGTYTICLKVYDANKICYNIYCKTFKFTKTREASATAYDATLTQSVTISPNPANSNLNIRMSVLPATITVLDLSGKVIMSNVVRNGNLDMNTSTWNEGMYIIKIQSAGGNSSHKIIINH